MPELAGGVVLDELVGHLVKLWALVLTAKVGTKTFPFATIGTAYDAEHHTSLLAYTVSNWVEVVTAL